MLRVLRVVAVVGVIAVLLTAGGAVAAEEHPEHEHPDEVKDDEDLAALERWLGGRMGQVHADCTEGMRVGNFDACEDLDEDYESLLSRYVTVERETTDEDERRAEQFEETRNKQSELADLMAEFDETLEAYQDARTDGDEARAREHARELRRLADRIEKLGGDVSVDLRGLDSTVPADLNESAEVTREETDKRVRVTEDIERETFDPTAINVTADSRAGFDAPATVRGVVTDENGTAIQDARVIIVDDAENRTTLLENEAFAEALDRTTRADENGTYELEYRPTMTEVGTTNVTVLYVPDDGSEYLGSNASTHVVVDSTASNVSVTETSAEVAFDDNVTIKGDVRAAGETVAGVPVVVSVGGERLETVRTDEDGRFETDEPLPVTVPTGEVPVTVAASRDGRALEPSNSTASMTVAETDTDLSLLTALVGNEIEISGRLTANNEADIGERPLTVTIDGEERSVTTDEDGRFSLSAAAADESHQVVVEYDEPRENLAPSREESTVEPNRGVVGVLLNAAQEFAETVVSAARASPILTVLLVGGLLANVGVGVFIWRRRWRSTAGASAPADATAASEPSSGRDPAAARRETATSLLEAARDRLERSPEAAVQVCYAAVRSGLGGDADGQTHWEFYNEFRDDLEEGRAAALRSITESFEQATFTPTGIDLEDARSALDNAERCLAASDGGADEPTD